MSCFLPIGVLSLNHGVLSVIASRNPPVSVFKCQAATSQFFFNLIVFSCGLGISAGRDTRDTLQVLQGLILAWIEDFANFLRILATPGHLDSKLTHLELLFLFQKTKSRKNLIDMKKPRSHTKYVDALQAHPTHLRGPKHLNFCWNVRCTKMPNHTNTRSWQIFKFWKTPRHKRDKTKRWCIPQIPSCNSLLGNNCFCVII